MLSPNGDGDGEIPRNIRLALTMTELVQPYPQWTGRTATAAATVKATKIPLAFLPGTEILLEWRVGGAITVDDTYLSLVSSPACSTATQPDLEAAMSAASVRSLSQSGHTEWAANKSPDKASNPLPTAFRGTITLPTTMGVYAVMIRAKVDQNWATAPPSAFPHGLSPQSHVVNARTKSALEWVAQVQNHKVQVQQWWYSTPICINVGNTSNPYLYPEFPLDAHSTDSESSPVGIAVGVLAGAVLVAVCAGMIFYVCRSRAVSAAGIGDAAMPHEHTSADAEERNRLCGVSNKKLASEEVAVQLDDTRASPSLELKGVVA